MNGVPDESIEIMLSSIAPSTLKQYNSALKQWYQYCNNNKNAEFYKPTRFSLLKYLTFKFNEGASYGSLNTHRSAISLLSQDKIGEDLQVCKFLKGAYRSRPSAPKYISTWDVSVVLRYLESIDLNAPKVTFKEITEKTVMLIALATAHRAQTIASIDIRNIKFSSLGAEILFTKLIKTSGPNRPQPCLKLPYFNNSRLCVASALDRYLKYTEKIRGNVTELFIALKGPIKHVGTQTISRWLKGVLKDSGIDT